MEHKNIHENLSSIFKKAHYADNKEHDNYPEVISEASKSSVKFTGDVNSEGSIGTSILDTEEHNVLALKKKLEEYEYKIKYLENENEHINTSLINEKTRAAKLEKKLQFVKDNQEVFMRLKEAYINMKYNEAAGRKMIEIREKAVQTWQGIICSSCAESEELRRQIDIMIEKYKELFVVSPGEMEHLLNTVKYLKDLVDRREKSWSLHISRQHALQQNIAVLKNENLELKKLAEKRDLTAEAVRQQLVIDEKLEKTLLDDKKVEEMQKFVECVTRDMEKLKKIIIKYEKKFREIKDKYPLMHISPLNDKETKIVQQLVSKYNVKVQQRSTDKMPEAGSITVTDRIFPQVPQSHRPSSPLGIRSKDDSGLRPMKPKCSKFPESGPESAIMMMDCLFD